MLVITSQRSSLVLLLCCMLSIARVQSFSTARGFLLPRSIHRKIALRSMTTTTTPEDDSAANNEDELPTKKMTPPRVQKVATLTICIVPPPSAREVWKHATRARTELKDPGLFRWPPHVNLLYPFINIKPKKDDDEAGMGLVDLKVQKRLRRAIETIEPFTVNLDRFGTFGGKKRGVLWLYPSSSNGTSSDVSDEPVHQLYHNLVREFPECANPRKDFNPHVTLSHFKCLEDAQAAQTEVEQWWPTATSETSFEVADIYLLQRKGDNGQFMRVASLGLGEGGKIRVHDPHLPFPDLPTVEADWVRNERMALKARRNGAPRQNRRNNLNPIIPGEDPVRGRSRSTDSAEEIAAKRAARKAKREIAEAKRTAQTGQRGALIPGADPRCGPSLSTDTAEEIAAKRAARKAKRDALITGTETGLGKNRSSETAEEIAAKRAARKAKREGSEQEVYQHEEE